MQTVNQQSETVAADQNSEKRYTATIILHSPGALLGGNRRATSSLLSYSDAASWASAAREINKARAGYENAEITTVIA